MRESEWSYRFPAAELPRSSRLFYVPYSLFSTNYYFCLSWAYSRSNVCRKLAVGHPSIPFTDLPPSRPCWDPATAAFTPLIRLFHSSFRLALLLCPNTTTDYSPSQRRSSLSGETHTLPTNYWGRGGWGKVSLAFLPPAISFSKILEPVLSIIPLAFLLLILIVAHLLSHAP